MTALLLAAALATPAAVSVEAPPVVLPGAHAPDLAAGPDGTLWLTWVERSGDVPAIRLSVRSADGEWRDPVTVVSRKELVVFDADPPSVAVLPDGTVFVQWLEEAGNKLALRVARSTDGGRTFGKPQSVGEGAEGAERGFFEIAAADGGARAVWLEGGAPGKKTVQAELLSVPWKGDAMGGIAALDGRVCDCCQLSIAASGGALLVAYRDRSPDEIRDVSVVRIGKDGASSPVTVAKDGWKTPTCPVNGPSIAADGKLVAVAWYTNHPDARVQVAFSSDGGATFGAPVRVDDGDPLGRAGVRLVDGAAVVTWVEEVGETPELRAAWAQPDGAAGESFRVSSFRGGTSSSYPRIAQLGKTVWVAFADGKGADAAAKLPKLVRVVSIADVDRRAKRGAKPAPTPDPVLDDAVSLLKSGAKKGQRAPEIEEKDFQGNPVKLSDYRGNVVMVSFWGTWCPPCVEETPEHVALRRELHARGFEILAVNSGDGEKTIGRFVEEHGIEYPVLIDTGTASSYQVRGYPTNLIVDRAGVIRARSQGYSPRMMRGTRELIEELLNEPAPER